MSAVARSALLTMISCDTNQLRLSALYFVCFVCSGVLSQFCSFLLRCTQNATSTKIPPHKPVLFHLAAPRPGVQRQSTNTQQPCVGVRGTRSTAVLLHCIPTGP